MSEALHPCAPLFLILLILVDLHVGLSHPFFLFYHFGYDQACRFVSLHIIIHTFSSATLPTVTHASIHNDSRVHLQECLPYTYHVRCAPPWCFLGPSSVLSVNAKTYKPTSTSQSAYSSIDGKALYVQGGVFKTGYSTNPAFMVDLSQSWNTSNPVYQQLQTGYVQNHAAVGVSSDRKWWTVLIGNLVARYSADTNAWVPLVTISMDKTFGVTGATDPATDMMYIPFAYAKSGDIATVRINLKTGEVNNDSRGHSMKHKSLYSTAWNALRESVIYVSPSGVYEYQWAEGWSALTKNGLTKIGLRGQCLVSVNGGKKMVLFGGTTMDQNVVIGDICILDVEKLVWTKGPTSPTGGRTGPSCAGSNGQVVIWGGSTTVDPNPTYSDQQMLVFNVNTNKWTDNYVAP
ncbi:MAG: hypothetical protein J3Q66DRAFT_392754 [Benniella sp.]|nr:MAG: hypothetical protein J3Q66DRAFT_392754 [Benniella sp.]